ncbi:MAG: GGDEF domain-containing protein [Thermodesulfobacteriota bacterium]|nr:GGDEF domain-containing protein [Thermodesulfobacteriota bacterium]
MMDIDFFKRFNDTYGHAAGDDCLREVAQMVNGSLRRAEDYAARYGGEEFAAILPKTDAEEAAAISEKLRIISSR